MSESSLRIALLGTRGVPARYSGFETCAEELGARLVERGHERHGVLPVAVQRRRGPRVPRDATRDVADNPAQIPRHDGSRRALDRSRLDAALRRRALFHRGQQSGDLDSPRGRHTHRTQREWSRLEAREVAGRGEVVFAARRAPVDGAAERLCHRFARGSGLLSRTLQARGRPTSPTGPSSSVARPARRWLGSD